MPKFFLHGGKKHRPVLDADGKMSIRTAVAYGSAGQYKFLASIYIRSVGPKTLVDDNFADAVAWREVWDQGMTEEEQERRLEFQCNVLATQLGLDYKLRLPHNPKRTPLNYYGKERRS